MSRTTPFLALIACGGLLATSAAWAASWADYSSSFPVFPCQDGWMGCIVNGKTITPDLQRSSTGKPQPANLRVSWDDLQPTAAFSPFVSLSEYTGQAPAVAEAEPEPEPEPEGDAVADAGGGGGGGGRGGGSAEPAEDHGGGGSAASTSGGGSSSSSSTTAASTTSASSTSGGGGGGGGSSTASTTTTTTPATTGGGSVRPKDGGATTTSAAPTTAASTTSTSSTTTTAAATGTTGTSSVRPKDGGTATTTSTTASGGGAGGGTAERPDGGGTTTAAKPPTAVVAAAPVDDSCDNLTKLEPQAMLGKLTDGQIACLEGSYSAAAKQTDKDKISRVLMANAYSKGDTKTWEKLIKRHLEEIDQSDPDLCYKYAQYLSKGGAARANGVIRWANVALENRTVWTGETYQNRVSGLYKLRAAAAQSLWKAAEDEHAKAPDDATKKKVEETRNQTKVFAREWYEYAKAAGKDTTTAMQLCVSAAGTKDYCEGA